MKSSRLLWALLAGSAVGCAQRAATPVEDAGTARAEASDKKVVATKLVPITTSSGPAREAFLKGRDASENSREADALKQFRRALELDPDFALASAYLGYSLTGAQGRKAIDHARALAQSLPEAERLFIDYLYASRFGDPAQVDVVLARLMVLAPDDWRVVYAYGQQAFEAREWDRAITAYTRSLETQQSCEAFNNLGYSLAMEERWDLAISAFKRCLALHPDEPNALDSLGEVYMAAGLPDQAAAVYQKARTLDPNFWIAYHGGAVVKFVKGDWAGGFALLAQARPLSPILSERLEVDALRAWALFAQGNVKEALQGVDALEKEAKAAGAPGEYDLGMAALLRSFFLTEKGRYPEALAAAKLALERSAAPGLKGPVALALKGRALLRAAMAQARAGNTAEAERWLKPLRELAASAKRGAELPAAVDLAEGAILETQRKDNEARAAYARCRPITVSPWTYDYRIKPEDTFCAAQFLRLDTKLGNRAAAAALRKRMLKNVSRDPLDLYTRTLIEAL